MTFLCTVDGELVSGNLPNGEPRTIVHEGVEFYDWPEPWAQRCDRCGGVFEYATCVAGIGGEDFCVDCWPVVKRERRKTHVAPAVDAQLTLEIA